MTDEEFAERKAQLQAERRRGIELLEAAYREQIRALELLHGSGGGQVPEQASTVAAPPATWVSSPAPVTAPALTQAPAAPAPPAPVRRSSEKISWDIQRALPRLPEVFTTPELIRVMGYSPHRGTLHRLLELLEDEGVLHREFRGEGKRLSRYRRLAPAPQETAGDGAKAAGAPETPAAAQEERGTPAPEPGASAGPGEATPDGSG